MKRFPIDCQTNCPHFHCLASKSGEGILSGLRDVFIKALKCNNPYEYNELIREWNEEIESINKICGFDYKNKEREGTK